MRRKFTIKASGGSVCATISVKLETAWLTRDEVQICVEDLASELMRPIPAVRYLKTPLSRIRITGV